MRKVKIDNPRYPHTIRIIRKKEEDWLAEESESGSSSSSSSSSSEESDEQVVYEGPGRSYTDTTTVGDSKVDSNKRKASIPVRFDEWEGLVPMSGDILYVTKENITEEWEVRDFEPDNNRSVIYGEMSRNFNIE